MFNITISAISGFFVFVCWTNPQEIGVLGAIGWIFVSGYFFLCSLIEQFIQNEKNEQDR
jgi:hypothetical protein